MRRRLTTSYSSSAGLFASWINSSRQDHGLRSMSWNGALASTSRSHSASMASRRSLYHSSNSQLISNMKHACSCSYVGEVVGVGPSLRTIFTSFMRSSEHRSVILKRVFRYVGVGIVYARGVYWVTVQFAG
ncbi:MAG: CAP domain-containing protein [Actinomycetota bacterium]